MNLFEFEGKQLFRDAGIPVPQSCLAPSSEALPDLPFPFVLKAQTMTGGRGKAGGIKVCQNEADFRQYALAILGMTIKGHPVHGLLAEEMVSPERELYLSITLQGVKAPTLIASAMGGMEIERVAAEHPQELLRIELDPFLGLKAYQRRALARKLKVADDAKFAAFLERLQKIFFEKDALLVEINPLGVIGGELVAMDAKVVLDDHARFRHEPLFSALEETRASLGYHTPQGDGTTITYVPLDGEIGLISDGAGTGMLALDLVTQAGGRVASFCELGGTTPAEVMYKAMEYTCKSQAQLKSILVVLIGGFNRMDDMANGITRYLADHPTRIPIFTRMCGTMEEEGFRIMDEAGLFTCRGLTETVEKAVGAAKEGQ